jgi:hypothetical protein
LLLREKSIHCLGWPFQPGCGRAATLKVVRRRKTQTTATAPGSVEAAENSLMTMASPQYGYDHTRCDAFLTVKSYSMLQKIETPGSVTGVAML